MSTGNLPAYKFAIQPGEVGYNPNNLYRNSQARYFLPSVDEWYKVAYYDPTTGNYFDFPTGSDEAPTPVASGTAPGTAVYLQDYNQGPADITLAGGLSPYGTMGQGGNVWEWEETDFDLVNDLVDGFNTSFRGDRGGFWNDPSDIMQALARFSEHPGVAAYSYLGFRVASTAIPEPSTLLLGALGAMGLMLRRKSLH